MSRILSLLIMALIAFGIFLIVRYVQDSYKTPTVTEIPTQASNEINLAQTESHYEQWHEFSSPTGHFKVLLPVLPQHATDKIIDPQTKEPHKYDMYVSAKDDGTVFMITAITFPDETSKEANESLLTKVVNDMLARNKDNKLKMMQAGNFRNFRTVDFSIENGDIILGGKAFIHNKTLYVLSMVSKHGTFNTKDFDFFVNSFDIVSNSKEEPTPTPAPALEPSTNITE